MLSRIKAWIPVTIKLFVKRLWYKARPARIKLTRFVEGGCSFEITTKMERSRVTGYGAEADYMQRVLSEIKSDDVFYDIGSCVGMFALHVALLGGLVIAFEPDPGYRKRLKRNIQINRLNKRIKIVDWAVSDEPGVTTLYTDGINGNSPSLRSVDERGSVTVNINTIDNAVASRQFPYPDLVKIDIEGAEILALRGMKQTLASEKAPRFLFIEFHPQFLPSFKSSVEECERLIELHGYTKSYMNKRGDQLHCIYKKE